MDEGQKKEFKDMFKDKKSTAHRLKPDNFDGSPAADAIAWLDNFRGIAKLNNWSEELQLNAFPLYLRGIAHARFITLADDTKGTVTALFDTLCLFCLRSARLDIKPTAKCAQTCSK